MQFRRFGRLGWQVSEIGYGMWGIGEWSGADDTQSMKSLERAVELGCNFFDTAWAYGSGHSERLLGRFIKSAGRSDLHVASKIPPKNRRWPGKAEYPVEQVFPHDYVREYLHKTLENLGTDSLHLMQLHVWDDAWTGAEGWRRALEDAKREGLIKGIGMSINRWEPTNVVKVLQTGLVDAVQVVYNVFDQNPEDVLFPLCKELGVAVIARVPFDEGSLTGTLTRETRFADDDFRSAYFWKENLEASVDRAEALKKLLPPGMTLAEMALRFILACKEVGTVIPGMRRTPHVEQNIGTSDGRPLPADLLSQLRQHRWDRTTAYWTE